VSWNKRYYNGVRKPQTTICCSAIALTSVVVASLIAQTQPPLPQTQPLPPQAPPTSPQTQPTSQKAPALPPFRIGWTVALNGSLTAPPVFSGQRGYFPLDEGRLAAYDLTGGKPLWVAMARIASPPAAGDGLVFIAEPETLCAVREVDGSVAWQVPFAGPLAAPLAWDNGWLIAVAASGTILAFRASDGELIWRRDVSSPVKARPALAADRVYLPAGDRIIALQVETGVPLWERKLGGALNDVLALEDRLYVGSDDNFLYCLKTHDGLLDWRWRTGADVVGMPAADGHRVYFVSLDNLLRGLDLKSGAQRWKRALPLRPNAGPLKAGDTLIVSGVAPMLRAYFSKDGAPAGDVATDGELASPPYFVAGPGEPTVVVVTRNMAKGAMLSGITRAIETPAPAAPAAPPGSPPPAPAAPPGSPPPAPAAPPGSPSPAPPR
jgi:outer membrane protein assembly factor BamB